MEAIADETAKAEVVPMQESPAGVAISVEMIAVVVLILLAAVLRLASLDSVSISAAETRQALATWREVSPNAPGTPIVSDTPSLFWAQRIGFSILGPTELAARMFTALAGVFLCVSPLLFRGLIGRVRAFSIALLLTFSPTVIAASRFSSGTVWAMCFAVIGLWALSRYWQTRQPGYGVGAVTGFVAMALLGGPSGVALALILAFGGFIGLALNTVEAPAEADVPGDDYLADVRQQFVNFPWGPGLGMALLVSAAVSTGFLIYPDGLGMVGEGLGGFVRGFAEPFNASDPIFYPLVTALFYDTWLWAFAVVAVVMLFRQARLDFVERFLIGWITAAVVVSFIWQGGVAADALWLVVPLAALAGYAISDALTDDDTVTLWIDGLFDDEDAARRSVRVGKYVLALVAFGLMIMMAIHFQTIGRGFFAVPGGSLGGFVERSGENAFANTINSVIWLVISLLFMVVGYFLAASVWGNGPSARGIFLGIVLFAVMSGVGSGWRVSVAQAGNPVEVWHTVGTHPDADTLRTTLQEFAFRETRGQPGIPIAVLAEEDGIIAWEIRDFSGAYFISDVSEAQREQFALLPLPEDGSEPDLGGSYVGQRFAITQVWFTQYLQGFDVMAWWAQLQTRPSAGSLTDLMVVLWVRQDVYESAPVDFAAG